MGGWSWATEEHHKNGQVDWAAKIKVSQVDLDWNIRVNFFLLGGPIRPQVNTEEMQHPDRLVIEEWTLYPTLTVKHALQSVR